MRLELERKLLYVLGFGLVIAPPLLAVNGYLSSWECSFVFAYYGSVICGGYLIVPLLLFIGIALIISLYCRAVP
jgi:hypothetical protein